MKNYNIGDEIKGIISGIQDYGIFLKLDNGYIGMIHISELSDYFVKDVDLYGEVGDELIVKILDINHDEKKVKCSLKETSFGKNKDASIDHGFAPLKNMLQTWIDNEKGE